MDDGRTVPWLKKDCAVAEGRTVPWLRAGLYRS